MRCYFCEKSDRTIPVSRIKITGKNSGKKKQKTCGICTVCSAMTDNDWIAGQLGWDSVSKVTATEQGGKS